MLKYCLFYWELLLVFCDLLKCNAVEQTTGAENVKSIDESSYDIVERFPKCWRGGIKDKRIRAAIEAAGEQCSCSPVRTVTSNKSHLWDIFQDMKQMMEIKGMMREKPNGHWTIQMDGLANRIRKCTVVGVVYWFISQWHHKTISDQTETLAIKACWRIFKKQGASADGAEEDKPLSGSWSTYKEIVCWAHIWYSLYWQCQQFYMGYRAIFYDK